MAAVALNDPVSASTNDVVARQPELATRRFDLADSELQGDVKSSIDEFAAYDVSDFETYDATEKVVAGGLEVEIPIRVSRPARRLFILACMDARLNLYDAFPWLSVGDAHIVRNAGGRPQEAIRSIFVSQRLLGTRYIYVVHHTNCGMSGLSNKVIQDLIESHPEQGQKISDLLPLPNNVDDGIREDVNWLKDNPYVIAGTNITGFVYDVGTKTIRSAASAVAPTAVS